MPKETRLNKLEKRKEALKERILDLEDYIYNPININQPDFFPKRSQHSNLLVDLQGIKIQINNLKNNRTTPVYESVEILTDPTKPKPFSL